MKPLTIMLLWITVDFAWASAATNGLRLMTYNVHNGTGLDDKTDYARIGGIVKALGPDAVALQELDSATARSQGHDVLAEIAAAAGMHGCFAAAIDFDGGKYGIGILSREEPLGWRKIALPGREEARTMLIAEFDRYVLACVHLSLTEADRMASLPIIREAARDYDKPFFLAGDLNAEPDDRFIEELKRSFRIVSTMECGSFPANEPETLLDYIAVEMPDEREIRVISSQIAEEARASDHRPVCTEVAF